MTSGQQVCLQLPMYPNNVVLPAFAHYMPLLLCAGQQSINISCPPGPANLQQQSAADGPCWDRQTDG